MKQVQYTLHRCILYSPATG